MNNNLTLGDNQKLIDSYQKETKLPLPELTPSRIDLESPTDIIMEIPLRSKPNPMIESWDTFWKTGIPAIINQNITLFGWALAAQRDSKGVITSIIPVRTNNRGLADADIARGMELFSKYMAKNANTLHLESFEAEHALIDAVKFLKNEKASKSEQNDEPAGDFMPDGVQLNDTASEPITVEEVIPVEAVEVLDKN